SAHRPGQVDDRASMALVQLLHGVTDEIGAELGVLAVQGLRMAVPLDDDAGGLLCLGPLEPSGDEFVVLAIRSTAAVQQSLRARRTETDSHGLARLGG